jgi:hypothetical protein
VDLMIRTRSGGGSSGTDATKISQLENDVGMLTAQDLSQQQGIKLAMTAVQPSQMDSAISQKIAAIPATTYSSLTGRPTLFSGAYGDLSGKPALFSGSYADLSGKPSIPASQVQSDWAATSGMGMVLNKPVLFSGAYADLSGKPSLFSGAYADLTGKPAIPAAQVQSDWNATSGLGVILNKPTIPTLSARYAKRHTTAADGTLTISWPTGRFTGIPVATAAAIINASDYVYRAQILTCDATGMTLRVTRSAVANQTIVVGGLVRLNESLTVPIDVMITAQVASD